MAIIGVTGLFTLVGVLDPKLIQQLIEDSDKSRKTLILFLQTETKGIATTTGQAWRK